MRYMHGDPARPWTVDELAKNAALSRSAFFERCARAVGVPPMEYLLGSRSDGPPRQVSLGTA